MWFFKHDRVGDRSLIANNEEVSDLVQQNEFQKVTDDLLPAGGVGTRWNFIFASGGIDEDDKI